MPSSTLNVPATPGREVANIAIPVSLEFVFIVALSLVNQLIVASLGTVAVAAVGFMNSINLIFVMTLGALGTSASILVARAFGAQREKELSTVVSSALLTAGLISTLLALPFILWPSEFLRLVGSSPEVIASGASYLAVLALSWPFAVVAAVFTGILRSANHPRSSLAATMPTVVLTPIIALILVFGWGPIPALGVVGAAWAITITTILKAAILAFQTYPLYKIAQWKLPAGLRNWRAVIVPLFVLGIPLGLTNIFWTTGNFIYNVIAQHISDDALASMQIVWALEAIFIVGSLGLFSAVTALVGRAVGAGDGTLAAAWVKKIKRIGAMTGLIFGVLFALSSLATPWLYPEIGPAVLIPVTVGILLNASIQTFKVRIGLMGAAILPSGDDVRSVVIGDFISPFLVGIPLALILSFLTPLGVYGIFVARTIEEFFKFGFFSWRQRRIQWDAVAARHFTADPMPEDPLEGLIQV
jgi:putative MATE family efflux protein